jgi:hypothetical protein
MAAISSEVATGRRMKGREGLMATKQKAEARKLEAEATGTGTEPVLFSAFGFRACFGLRLSDFGL